MLDAAALFAIPISTSILPHPSNLEPPGMARRTASRKVAPLRPLTPELTVALPCEVYVVTSQERTREIDVTHQLITSMTRHACTVRGVYTNAVAAKAAAENWLDEQDLVGWNRQDWQEGGGRTSWDLNLRSRTSCQAAILRVEKCLLEHVPMFGHSSSADEEGGKGKPFEISSGSSDSVDDQGDDGVSTILFLFWCIPSTACS